MALAFEQLQELALGAIGESVAVLVDALIEAGRIDAEGLTLEALAEQASQWAAENALRKTGRTLRMLETALEAAADGRSVLVLAVDPHHVELLESKLEALATSRSEDRRIVNRVRVSTTQHAHRDRSIFGGEFVLEDHHTIEMRKRRESGR